MIEVDFALTNDLPSNNFEISEIDVSRAVVDIFLQPMNSHFILSKAKGSTSN